jgi:hypothetical protein
MKIITFPSEKIRKNVLDTANKSTTQLLSEAFKALNEQQKKEARI